MLDLIKITKLESMPYAQAHLEHYTNGRVYLVSYSTIVAVFDIKESVLSVYGLYSMTTRKHIGAFVKQMTNGVLSYGSAKYCYENHCSMSTDGEILDYILD